MAPRTHERAVSYAKRVARVAAYGLFVTVVLGLFAARSVYAALTDSALEMGGELMKLGDVVGPRSRVRVNGEAVNVASAMTDSTVTEVMDRFEAECREHAGGLAEELANLPDTVRANAPPALEGGAGIGVLRNEERGRGVVACLARDGHGGTADLARAFGDFMASGDLSKLGKLRYVVAERARGATRTHVVTAWTDEPLHVAAMFPREGDAPGSDADHAPRPDGARRLLAASVDGAPFSVRVYDAPGAETAVLALYDREMPARGWEPIAGVAREAPHARAYVRDGVDLMVTTDTDGDRTIVSVVEMPPR
jgi:hypothetical protein